MTFTVNQEEGIGEELIVSRHDARKSTVSEDVCHEFVVNSVLNMRDVFENEEVDADPEHEAEEGKDRGSVILDESSDRSEGGGISTENEESNQCGECDEMKLGKEQCQWKKEVSTGTGPENENEHEKCEDSGGLHHARVA